MKKNLNLSKLAAAGWALILTAASIPVWGQADTPPAVSAAQALENGKTASAAQNYRDAQKWYRIAAEQGDAEGQCLLGESLFNDFLASSYGQTGDCSILKEADSWLKKSALQGNVEAESFLGRDLSQKNSCRGAQFSEAIQWLTKAAGKGNGLAQYRLGKMYLKGEGIARNKTKARFWLQKAADNGNKYAAAALKDL